MYECDFCSFRSLYQSVLNKHKQNIHPFCNTCQRMFYNHRIFLDHFEKSNRHNYCRICDRDFQSPAARRQHYRESTGHHSCEICERIYSSPAALQAHQLIHTADDIECPRCDNSFASASNLVKHMESGKCFKVTHKQIVDKIRGWEIKFGARNIVTVPRLGDETYRPIQATRAVYTGSPYKCSVCPKKFRQLNHLNQHLRSDDHLPEEFRCIICDYTATWLSGLIRHFESERCGFWTFAEMKHLAITSLADLRRGK